MKKLIGVAAVSLLMLGSAQAQQAKAPLYGELGYTQLKLSGGGMSLKPGMIRGIVGYDFHPNLAVEGMAGFGVKDDSINVAGVDVNVKIQRAYGVFFKPKVNVSNEVELFMRLGYSNFKAKASAAGVSVADSDGDYSYGVGLNYNITPKTHIGVDYMSYSKKDGAKTEGWTIGVGYRF